MISHKSLVAAACVLVPAAALLVARPQETAPTPGPATPTTLLVVRHADRAGKDDALTEAGNARARALAHTVAKAGVAAIYCTKTERTRKTAAPVATALGLTPTEIDGRDLNALLDHVFKNHEGKTVLVVGHSNTVPAIVAACGGARRSDIPDDEFDDLYVVTVGADRSLGARVVALQYGAPSP